MVSELLAAAQAQNCTLVELSVLGGNERAIALYEKLGFRTYAVIPRAYRLSDGYRDEVVMIKYLDEGNASI